MKTLQYYLAFFLVLTCIGSQSIKAQNSSKYKVVINHEEQYSIWPANMETTSGWKDTKVTGNQGRCRKYIEEVWTDMRPMSIKKMNLPEDAEYWVVINHEEQYSIWPIEVELPENWRKTDFSGNLYPCVKYIKKVWTDMRPLSMRNLKVGRH